MSQSAHWGRSARDDVRSDHAEARFGSIPVAEELVVYQVEAERVAEEYDCGFGL